MSVKKHKYYKKKKTDVNSLQKYSCFLDILHILLFLSINSRTFFHNESIYYSRQVSLQKSFKKKNKKIQIQHFCHIRIF